MKPHLPALLYAALLAAIAPVPATAEPATYGKLISAEQINITSTGPLALNYYGHQSVPDATEKDWVLTLTASDLSPTGTQISSSRTAQLIDKAGFMTIVENESNWRVEPHDNAFQIGIAPDGDLFIAFESTALKGVTHVLNNSNNFRWTHVDEVSVTLSYNAASGKLSLEGGSIKRTDNGNTQVFNGIDNLDYQVNDNFFSATIHGMDHPRFKSGTGGTLVSTLISESGDEGWKISGTAGIQELQGGSYSDRALQSSDKIQFTGVHGILYTNSDYTLENEISASAALDALEEGTAIGFGAAAGKTLTVTQGTAAINNAEAGTQVDVLHIVGEGTVKLSYSGENSADLSAVQVRLADSATLEIDDSGTLSDEGAQIALHAGRFSQDAAIVKSGKATDLVLRTGEATTSLNQITNTQGNLDITGNGLLQVQNLTAEHGSISLNSDTTCTGTLAAAGKVRVSDASAARVHHLNAGELEVAASGSLTATGSAEVNGSVQLGGTVQMNTLKAGSVTMTGSGTLESSSISAASITAGGVSASWGSTAAPLFSNGVRLDESGITAGSMSGATLEVAGTEVLRAASTDSSISISATGILAEGSVTAAEVRLSPVCTIRAARLQADKMSVEGSATSLSGATLTGVHSLSGTAASVKSVAADSITLADGYQLSADSIKATHLSVGTHAVIHGATITDTQMFVGNEASLDQVTLGSGSTLQSTQMNMNGLVVSQAFGGASGQAFRKGEHVDSLVLTGKTMENDIALSYVVLNGEALDFSGSSSTNQAEHRILLADGTISYDTNPANYELYIQSYTRARLELSGGSLIIRGYRDEEGIKNELTDTANRKLTLAALDETGGSGEAAWLKSYVGHVNRYTLAERKQVLDAISGASTAALADSQRLGIQDLQSKLRNRIIQAGGGTNAGLITDWEYVGLQAWAQADGSFSSSKGSGDECGYDYNAMGATVGANLDLSARTVAGLAFSASYGEIDSDGADHARGNNDARYLSLFARHQQNHWVHMLILSAGFNEMDLERSVSSYSASGDTKGSSLSAYYETGYTIGLNYEYTHVLQPMVSISLTSAKVDSYTESGSLGNAALTYDGDNYLYGKIGLGARYQGVLYETIHERNAVLEARALVTRDFGDTTDTARVALGGGTLHEVTGADTSGTGVELGFGISIPVEQHTTLYADADLSIAPDYTALRANAGMRYDF